MNILNIDKQPLDPDATMNFLDINELPLDPDVNCGCTTQEEGEFDEFDEIKCGFCKIVIEDSCQQYSISELDFRYLCQKCSQKDIGLCNYNLNFFFVDELMQLSECIRVHYDEHELIDTYRKVTDKGKYLEMVGIDPQGAKCEEINLKSVDENTTQ